MTGVLVRFGVTSLVAAFMLAMVGLLPYKMPAVDPLTRPGKLSYAPLGPLFGGAEVTQEFIAAGSGLDAVDLQLATYRRKNKGTLSLRIEKLNDGRWVELARTVVDKGELDDNSFHRFEFSSALPVRRGERVAIRLQVNGSYGHAIAWYYTPEWHLAGAALRSGDSPVEGTAHFQPLYRTNGTLAGMGWWSRLTVLLGTTSRLLLAVSGLLVLSLFLHLCLWPPYEPKRRNARSLRQVVFSDVKAFFVGIAAPIDKQFVLELARILMLFAVLVGIRGIFVGLYAESVLWWDQWDAEGIYLIKPWLEGELSFLQLFSPHNEHRVFWTRLCFLALLEANGGQWDNLVVSYANTALRAAIDVFLYVLLSRQLKQPWKRLALALVVVVLTVFPFGWENTLVGFQNQFYFLIAFAVGSIALAANGADKPSTVYAVAFLGVCSLFTMASGMLAPLVAAGILLWRARQGTMRRLYAAPGAIVLLAMAAWGYSLVPVLEYHAGWRAQTLPALVRAFWIAVAWPLPGWFIAPLLVWSPLLLYLTRLRRRFSVSGVDLFALGLATWVLLQAAAMAYARGNGMEAPSPRYTDILALGLCLNLWLSLRSLNFPLTLTRSFGLTAASFALVVLAGAFGLGMHASADFKDMATHARDSIKHTENVRAFVADGDPTHLSGAPAFEIPYPSGERLAMILADASVRTALPATVRKPLTLSGPEANGFTLYGGEADRLVASCGAQACAANTGTWRSATITGGFQFVRFPVASGSSVDAKSGRKQGNDGLQLAICKETPSVRCIPRPLSGQVLTARVRVEEPFQLEVADRSPREWMAVGPPVEIGWMSLVSRRLKAWTRKHVPHEWEISEGRGNFVDLPFRDEDAQPWPLPAGASIGANLENPKSGLLTSISVWVGKSERRVAGRLRADLCRGSVCVHAEARLRGMRAGRSLTLTFPEPLAVQAGEPLVARFTTSHGSRGLTLLSWPSLTGSPGAWANPAIEPAAEGRTLRLRLWYLRPGL